MCILHAMVKQGGASVMCDPYRDSLGLHLSKRPWRKSLPLLAICRGEQILNVSQGGDLIVDIVADYGNSINHRSEGDRLSIHAVNIDTLKQSL